MRNEDDDRQLKALRDMYAGGAMSLFNIIDFNRQDFDQADIAEFCFDLADAMIAERQKRMENK